MANYTSTHTGAVIDAAVTKITATSSSATELNLLDGVTATTAEINILDGVTSTAAELNILDGVTSTASELNILDGVTATAAEINLLDGLTATTTELNLIDGVTATTAEINYIDGVTSNIQTQLNLKAPIAGATFTGTTTFATLSDGTIAVTAWVDEDNMASDSATLIPTQQSVKAYVDTTAQTTEEVQDIVGAMFSSNTESGITVTYEDGDGTIDLTVGTLNQDTTGNAATATALETARTIHGVSFNGSANIDLSEVIQDTVGAMFSSNTETNITATYEDSDGTIDLVATGDVSLVTSSHDYLSISGQAITLGEVDISDDTNLAAGTNISLSGDTLNVDDAFLINSGNDTTSGTITAAGFTTTGTLAAGLADIDDVVINGTTIGHTDDTDLITLADGNVTIAGELDLTTLDVSGDADIDGTLEADAYTVAGTALNEYISDTVGAMVSSNTESGITVAYQDGDNTLDFTVGTLNQDTTGTASKVTVTDSTANTNFPVVFHDEGTGNVLLDDTGALRYNPSTGELLVPKLTVAGTTTTVDTVTMNAANAIKFEGATADANETILSIVDPTNDDNTQYLLNASGYIPLLAAATTTTISSTPAELNVLDGITSTTAELNILDGVTSTAAELNILDGVTSTTAELNILDGATVVVGEINYLDLGSTAVGTAIASKAVILDSNKDYTGVRNLTITGELDAATLDISGDADIDGTLETDALSINGTAVSSTAAELNILDGVTATAAELNIMDGVTATTAELNYTDGVTSNIQTQLDALPDTAGTNITLSGTTLNVDDAFLINSGNDTTSGTITAGGFTTTGNLSLAGHAVNDIDIGSEFVDADDHLMTSGAIKEKIEDYGYTTDANVTHRTITAGGNTLAGSETLAFTAGSNVAITESGGAVTIASTDTNTTYTGGTNLTLSGTTFNVDDAFLKNDANDVMAGHLNMADDKELRLGNDSDLRLVSNNSNTFIDNYLGNMYIRQTVDDQDILFQCDDGSGGLATYLTLDGSAGYTIANKKVEFANGIYCAFGNGTDAGIYHDVSNFYYRNWTGAMIFLNEATDADMYFKVDDGGGNTITAIQIDSSEVADVLLPNSYQKLKIGASSPLHLWANGTNSFIENYTGDLYITNQLNDKDIILQSDDGSGGVTPYLTIDGSATAIKVAKNLEMADNVQLRAGTGDDLQIYHDGTNSYLKVDYSSGGTTRTSEINMYDSSDGSMKFKTDNASTGGIEFWTEGTQRMEVQRDGNVGIGTASPLGVLNVIVPTYSNRDTDAQHTIIANSGDAGKGLRIGYDNSGHKAYMNVLDPSVAWGDLILQDGAGKVGIGTASPGTKVEIKALGDTSQEVIKIRNSSGTEVMTIAAIDGNGDGYINFNTSPGTINTNGGDLVLSPGGSGNVGIGTNSPATTLEVDGILTMEDVTAPAEGVSGHAQMFSNGGEMKVNDASGNITTISPHNFELIPEGSSEDMAWSHHSVKGNKTVNVDMMRLARLVEELTGEKLVYTDEQ